MSRPCCSSASLLGTDTRNTCIRPCPSTSTFRPVCAIRLGRRTTPGQRASTKLLPPVSVRSPSTRELSSPRCVPGEPWTRLTGLCVRFPPIFPSSGERSRLTGRVVVRLGNDTHSCQCSHERVFDIIVGRKKRIWEIVFEGIHCSSVNCESVSTCVHLRRDLT